mmetsp:Transcript_52334/g.122952  ORF Transcript_52334/g.122952 Transcript_52334/m.122952 type:complete len:534 (+) Transcript_52334:52-1653(+)
MAPGVAELEKMRLSPRFVAKLMEGAGEGLLVRAVEETRHRAFFIWQQHPWMSEQENWLAAEQSLLRPAQSNALKFEAATQTQWEEEGQDYLKEASHGAPIAAGCTESASLAACVSATAGSDLGTVGQISRSDRVENVEMIGQVSDSLKYPASVTQGRPETGFDLGITGFTRDVQPFGKGFPTLSERTETLSLSNASCGMIFRGECIVPAPCREEKTAVHGRVQVVADFTDCVEVPASEELSPAVARMCSMQRLNREHFMVSPYWKALQGDSVWWGLRRESSVPSLADRHTGSQTERGKSTCHARNACAPRLAESAGAAKSSSDGGPGFARVDAGRMRWPGSNAEVPPLPAPPENHPLLTPRTGACSVRPFNVPKLALAPQKSLQARKAGQEFLISTPHLPGEVQGLPQLPQAVPRSVSRSVSPSPSSFSDGSLDSLDIYSDWDWERVASLQTTASGVQEADLTRRSARFSSARSGSARSDFSVCGLYGCGDKAESQVLRKVIRDLEERLQAQSQELEILKAKMGTAPTVGAAS